MFVDNNKWRSDPSDNEFDNLSDKLILTIGKNLLQVCALSKVSTPNKTVISRVNTKGLPPGFDNCHGPLCCCSVKYRTEET